MNPKDRKYSKEHEWTKQESDKTMLVGITNYAQEQLGDIVFFSLPKPNTKVKQSQKLGEVESVKAVSDIYSSISGTIVEVNTALEKNPEIVNQDPYGKGWLLRIRPDNPSEVNELLTAEQYEEYLKGLSH